MHGIEILALLVILGVVLILFESRRHKSCKHHPKKDSLYERLGGIYPISAVVNHFSDNLLSNPIVGVNSKNPYLRSWSMQEANPATSTRLPGLKFMRTLWVCDVAGGPFKFHSSVGAHGLNLQKAHCPFKISSDEFDAVAQELSNSLDYFKVPAREKQEVLAAFAAHKGEVIFCSGRS